MFVIVIQRALCINFSPAEVDSYVGAAAALLPTTFDTVTSEKEDVSSDITIFGIIWILLIWNNKHWKYGSGSFHIL